MSNMVDFVPFLRNFPSLTMVNRGRKLHEGLRDTVGTLIKDIDRRMKAGEDVPDCLAKYLLSVQEEENMDDLDIIFICCAFMIGGVETVSRIYLSVCQRLTVRILKYRRLPSSNGSRHTFQHSLRSRRARRKSLTV